MRNFCNICRNHEIQIVTQTPERHISTNPVSWECKIRKSINPPKNFESGDRWSRNFESSVKIPLFLLYWLHWRIFSWFSWKSKVWSLVGLQTRGFAKICPRDRFRAKARDYFWKSSQILKRRVGGFSRLSHLIGSQTNDITGFWNLPPTISPDLV